MTEFFSEWFEHMRSIPLGWAIAFAIVYCWGFALLCLMVVWLVALAFEDRKSAVSIAVAFGFPIMLVLLVRAFA